MSEKKHQVLIDEKSVSITLFVPLCPKAFETKRKNPVVVDQKAVEILENIDFDTRPYLQKRSYHAAITRTWILDKEVKEFIRQNPTCKIINLGCGLDTRICRVDNKLLKWFDIDLPDVIELRRKFFNETDRVKYISKLVTDFSWIDDVDVKTNERVLIIAEGLLGYFEESEIKEIFEQLIERIPQGEILFTVLHKFLIGKEITKGTKFRWGLNKAEDILKIDERLEIVKVWRMSDHFKNRQTFLMRVLSILTSTGKDLNRILHLKLNNSV